MDDLTQIAQDELDSDEAEVLASVEEIAAELAIDSISSIMAEPAGPLKRVRANRPTSGPVDTGAPGTGGARSGWG